MTTTKGKAQDQGGLWFCAFAFHACFSWIGLEFLGDNFLWVWAADPWIKDVMTPPLTTIINLPCGLLSAGCACAAAWAAQRLFRRGGFNLCFFLLVAGASAFVLAMLRGNFVVFTGPRWHGAHSQDWHRMSITGQVALSAGAAAGVIVIEGVALWGAIVLARLSQKQTPATAS